jgi:WS/DGAT/MGAT family acyltransferase
MLNGELTSQRTVVVAEFSLRSLARIGRRQGGTINDALAAICGGALRSYLLEQDALPRRSLEAGMPVAIRRSADHQGNSIGYIVCPFGTDIASPERRLQRIVRTTRKAKADLGHVTPTATEDFANVMMLPYLVLTMTHSTQRLPPPFNAIVSNVPGPKQTLYLDGSRLEKIYPLSIVTDGMGLNITVISYGGKMYVGVLANGSSQPGIEHFDRHLKRAYRDLATA